MKRQRELFPKHGGGPTRPRSPKLKQPRSGKKEKEGRPPSAANTPRSHTQGPNYKSQEFVESDSEEAEQMEEIEEDIEVDPTPVQRTQQEAEEIEADSESE